MDISLWSDMMPHTLSVEPFTSIDAYGAATYGAAVQYTARIRPTNRSVTTATGEERVTVAIIYVAGASIGPQDRITLPAPASPVSPDIFDVTYVSDESGHHHTVIYAQRSVVRN